MVLFESFDTGIGYLVIFGEPKVFSAHVLVAVFAASDPAAGALRFE